MEALFNLSSIILYTRTRSVEHLLGIFDEKLPLNMEGLFL